MNADEARQILLKHFEEFPIDVKNAVNFVLETWEELYRKKLYNTWQGIKKRCRKSTHKGYERYGGRGITVADEFFDSFETFYCYVSTLDHFGEEGYTLDRIDNNKGYERGNLRWATAKQQSNNRQCTTMVEYQGNVVSLSEAADLSGINHNALKKRYEDGERGKELFKPLRNFIPPVEYNGKLMPLYEIAEKTGIKYSTLLHRYHKGKRGEELFRRVKQQTGA